MPAKPDLRAALDLKFHNDLGKTTFREYFRQLLRTLITEDESFSGKRPFGNSGWFHQLAGGLHEHGLLGADSDEDDPDLQKAEKLVLGMIDEMCKGG